MAHYAESENKVRKIRHGVSLRWQSVFRSSKNVPQAKIQLLTPIRMFKTAEFLQFSFYSTVWYVRGRWVLKIQKIHINRRIIRPFVINRQILLTIMVADGTLGSLNSLLFLLIFNSFYEDLPNFSTRWRIGAFNDNLYGTASSGTTKTLYI